MDWSVEFEARDIVFKSHNWLLRAQAGIRELETGHFVYHL